MQVLDFRGSEIELRARRGGTVQFELDVAPTDLTGYSVRFRVGDELLSTYQIDGSVLLLTLSATLLDILPPASRYAVTLIAPDGTVSPLVYGALLVSEWAV